MSNKMIQSIAKSKFSKTLTASLMAVSVFVPVASSVSADESQTTCTMTIYASKNTVDNFAHATGECGKEIDGYYSPNAKTFRTAGAYTGEVKNGQKEEIGLTSDKYASAIITFYTVNDLEGETPETKPPTTSKPTVPATKPATSTFVAFKGITTKTTTVWSGTTSKSKKVGTLIGSQVLTLKSEKANRYSITYKGKKRWVDKAAVSTLVNEFKVQTTTDKLNVRTGPSTKYKVITQLRKGFKMNASQPPYKGWYMVEYAPKKYGYVSSKYARKYVEFKKFNVKTKDVLNVRTGASTKNKVIGKLKKGSTVTVIGSKNEWYTISYTAKKGYKTGYISAKYTTKVSSTKKK